MPQRLFKEARLLLPPWIFTLLAMAAGWLVFSGSESREAVLVLLACGSVLIAASSFGAEFSHHAFTQLLVQPIDRRRIWFEKMLVLGAALAPVFLALVLARWSGRGGPFKGLLCVVPLCAFCGTPFLTLLFRSAIAGVVFSLGIPLMIWLGGGALVVALIKLGVLQEVPGGGIIEEALLFRCLTAYFVLAFVGYCVGSYWLGYRRFRNLEVLDGPMAGSGFGGMLERPFERLLHACLPNRPRPITVLLKKELKLQHPTFLVCGAFLLIEAMVLSGLRLFPSPSFDDVYFTLPLILYCGFVPLTVGAIAVAEERNYGVLTWHLTLPISARDQWRIKMLVSLGVSLILGVAVPCVMIVIGHALYPPLPTLGSLEFWPSFFICLAEGLATAVALYASSVSNTSLRAIILGAGLALGLGVLADLTIKSGAWLGPVVASALGVEDHYAYGWSLALNRSELFAVVALALAMALVLGTLLECAYGNYRRSELDRRVLWRHAAVVLIPSVCFVWATTAFLETVYWRFR